LLSVALAEVLDTIDCFNLVDLVDIALHFLVVVVLNIALGFATATTSGTAAAPAAVVVVVVPVPAVTAAAVAIPAVATLLDITGKSGHTNRRLLRRNIADRKADSGSTRGRNAHKGERRGHQKNRRDASHRDKAGGPGASGYQRVGIECEMVKVARGCVWKCRYVGSGERERMV
jgi:hypothetical protein